MTTMRATRLLLSSKNPTLRAGVKKLLKSEPFLEIVAETTSARETLREALRLNPDFVLMDADMAGPATLSAIRQMKRANGNVQIWVCSLWEDADLIAACLEAGASGSVPAAAGSAKLLRIFRRDKQNAHRNGSHLRRELKSRVAAMLILATVGLATIAIAQQTTPSAKPIPPGSTVQPPSQNESVQNQPSQDESQPEQSAAVKAEKDEAIPEEEEEPKELRHFYFTSPLALSGVRETRLPVERQKFDDNEASISLPEITIANVQPLTEFYLSYHPTIELFSNHDDLDSATQTVGLRFAHQFTPRWVFAARDSFLRTDDPTRKLQENVFLLPRTPYQENVASLAADYLKNSRTKYSLELDNTLSYLSLKNLEHPTLPSDRFDQVASGLTAAMEHKFAQRQKLTVGYSLLLFRNLHSGLPETIRSAHNANALYEYGWDQRGVYVALSSGVLHGGGTSYSALARIGYAWRAFEVYTGYSRQFAFVRGFTSGPQNTLLIGTGLSPATISEVVTLNMTGTMRSHVVVDLAGTAGRGASALPSGEIRSVTGRAQIAYRVGRVFPFIGAEFYGQNLNPLTDSRMSRSRYFAGLAVSLSPVAEAANTPVGDYSSKWPLSAPGLAPHRTSKLEKGELK